MNKFESWVLKQKVWVHIILSLFTYGLWLIVLLVVYIKKSNTPTTPSIKKVETKPNVIKKPLYEKRFVIDECENYQENIDKIVELEKPNMTLYEGLSTSEMKLCSGEIYEIDGEETPNIILRENKGQTIHYISVCMYHSKYDRYLTIGKIPASEQDHILELFDKNILIWGTFKDGNYKTLDDNDRLKLYKEPVKVQLYIKIYDK